MAARIARSRRVTSQPGEKAIAPPVDHPSGFGIENRSGRSLTVSFKYDAEALVQTWWSRNIGPGDGFPAMFGPSERRRASAGRGGLPLAPTSAGT